MSDLFVHAVLEAAKFNDALRGVRHKVWVLRLKGNTYNFMREHRP